MKSALSRNSPADAIKVAVTAFPSKGKEEAARKAAAEAFAAALLAVPRDGIDTIINSLSSKDRTTVLKYVYKSMSLPFDKKSYDLLLLWQNKIVTLVRITVWKHICNSRDLILPMRYLVPYVEASVHALF